MHPLLEINGLTVNFVQNGHVTTALQSINLTIRKGELLALVGESGSGKSVTSLSVLGLVPSPPAQFVQGDILFYQGEQCTNLLQSPAPVMEDIRGQKIAMIFQEPMTSLNPVHTCGHQVMEALLQHKAISEQEARIQTLDLFAMVKLPDPQRVFKSYPHQISGGQKQRVMIAMAMSCHPDLLICDEPTTALDVTVQKSVLQLIKDLQAQNQMGVLFITHDLGVVAEIADRIAVMYKGHIVEEGATQQIFTQPAHPYTRALLACRPALYPKGQRLPVVSDFLGQEHRGVESSKTEDRRVEDRMIDAVTIEDKKVEHRSIEDRVIADRQVRDQLYPDAGGAPLLRVKDLHVWYPSQRSFLGKPTAFTKAVNGVSFDLWQGETLGLVGESGCGKSTLGRALLRLIPPTSGELLYRGQHIVQATGKFSASLRRDMQIIFQDPYSSLNPRRTIGDAIAEPLTVHHIGNTDRQRKEVVINLLEKVGLQPIHYHRYPHEFSGGQRQRIVIARALALQPSFVVCDESVSALDVSVQAQVLNLLNDLKKEFGFTAIFISHDLSVVKYISDRIMVMHKGQIVEEGPAEQVYYHPQNDYTRQLIASIPQITPQQ